MVTITDEDKIKRVEKALDGTRDYYSIEWPLVSREWTFGVYVNEALEKYLIDKVTK